MQKGFSRKGAKPQNMKNEFLEKLANLCEQYDAAFSYTTDDDGIHIELSGQEIFVGYLYTCQHDVPEVLRRAMD